MSYKIVIAATTSGTPLIGATDVNYHRKRGEISDEEKVFGIQIPHRCVAATPSGPRIMTPREARGKGYEYRMFPPNEKEAKP